MKRYLIVFSMLFVFLAGCNTEKDSAETSAEESKLQPVTFVLDWTPNTNHTGIYVAQAESD